ncbi:hypothetical protein OG707_39765 [Streptomyces sp. NBC_01465]|nr:arabinofuranosidase catalytic domain-containing protein [Streptomyces sp. NBC_01465]
MGLLAPGGYADAAAQDTFCQNSTCAISKVYRQRTHGCRLHRHHLLLRPVHGVGSLGRGGPGERHVPGSQRLQHRQPRQQHPVRHSDAEEQRGPCPTAVATSRCSRRAASPLWVIRARTKVELWDCNGSAAQKSKLN